MVEVFRIIVYKEWLVGQDEVKGYVETYIFPSPDQIIAAIKHFNGTMAKIDKRYRLEK